MQFSLPSAPKRFHARMVCRSKSASKLTPVLTRNNADKYADKSRHSLVPFQQENTVLGSMAASELTFVLWLYATVIIRDGMLGNFNTEEVHWFYNKSLKMMQDTLQKETAVGNYSESLIRAVACITATAVSPILASISVEHRLMTPGLFRHVQNSCTTPRRIGSSSHPPRWRRFTSRMAVHRTLHTQGFAVASLTT